MVIIEETHCPILFWLERKSSTSFLASLRVICEFLSEDNIGRTLENPLAASMVVYKL